MTYTKSLLAAALLCGVAGTASAQIAPTTITNTATRLDASAFSNGFTTAACNTVNTSAPTLTITPPAGQFVYLTNVSIDITTDATGTSATTYLSSTNITGSPVWSLATLTVAAAVGGMNARQINETYNPPLKATAAGTAVTLVQSAAAAHNIFCVRATGYYAP